MRSVYYFYATSIEKHCATSSTQRIDKKISHPIVDLVHSDDNLKPLVAIPKERKSWCTCLFAGATLIVGIKNKNKKKKEEKSPPRTHTLNIQTIKPLVPSWREQKFTKEERQNARRNTIVLYMIGL